MLRFTFSQKWAAVFMACLSLPLFSSPIFGQRIYALSGNNLASFDAGTPSGSGMIAPISGVAAGQSLEAIDFRPKTGELYGIGYNSATGEARIYTINTVTAVATPVGAGPISVVPSMGDITFDFNPTVDRIRFMGSNNANYRLHPVLGTIAATDGNLAFAATDVNSSADPEIGAGAYSNSYIAATATTLYNYDTKLNIFTAQTPPNNGTQNTIGASGIVVNPADPSADFDVFFDAVTRTNMFFLAANTGSSTLDDLYTVNIVTGQATLSGSIGMPIRDIAVQITRTVPPLAGDLMYALTSNNWLISFDATNPGIVRTAAPVTGITAGQTLAGMDFRPATGELFAIGYNSTSGETQLYTLKTSNAAATPVGAAAILLPPDLGKIGMDFNPTVDRIRVTSSSNGNFRLHPATGALAATDANLSFNTGDANFGKNPSIGAVAYTNSVAGATATVLFNYDDSLNILTTQLPPNNGTLNTVGASGIVVNLADPTNDLDIFYDKISASNRAYLIANVGTSNFDDLYTMNLSSGTASLVGRIGNGSALVDLAASIAPRVAVFCPANITVTTAIGQPTAMVNYTAPIAATGCEGGLTGLPSRTSGLPSGSAFVGGASMVCYAATDACGNTGTCCFTVQVNETPCDVKTIGCLKFEMLNVRVDAKGDKIMRVRVTNSCASPLTYAAFQVQNGTTAVSPADGSTYIAASGNKYTVRSPNFSPFYSIRFRSQSGAGIKGGQSEVFQYTLPNVTGLNDFHVIARTDDGNYYEWYINIYKCSPNLAPPGGEGNGAAVSFFENENSAPAKAFKKVEKSVAIFPNPSGDGALQIDLADFSDEAVEISVFDATGRLMSRRAFENSDGSVLDFSAAASGWANGLYCIKIRGASGAGPGLVRKWVLQR